MARPRRAAAPRVRLTLGLAIALVLLGSSPAAALQPACPQRTSGFVVSSLCLQLPTGDSSATGSALLERAGVQVSSQPTSAGVLFIQAGISGADRIYIALAQERDIAALERDFARAFDPAPSVYVFREARAFEVGMVVLFRLPPALARDVATGHGGALDRSTVTVALGWHVVRLERPLTMLRHELTHAMVNQIAGADSDLPAWLEEGIAEMSRNELSDADPAADLALTAALLSSSRVSLSDLATTENWLRQSALLGGRSYAVARSAAELLSRDVGRAGLVEMLERTSRGESFATAYGAVATTSLGSFVSQFPSSIATAAPRPSVVTDPRRRPDGNIAWSLQGFAPNSQAEVTIDGAGYHVAFPVTIGAYGTYSGSFGATAPVGAYTIAISSGGSSVSTFFWTGPASRDTHDDAQGRTLLPR